MASPSISDRGKAIHFHGRESILRDFRALCDLVVKDNLGTSFLIEGAPGAGKTALLDECADRARQSGWLVPRKIPVRSVYDTDEMRCVVGGRRKFKFLRGTLGGWGLGWAGGSTISTPYHVLEEVSKPLLLVLDEAQRLHALADRPGSEALLAMDVLDRLHNGGIGRPIILLAGGLGTTTEAFRRLSISRFRGGCRHVIGGLKPDAERAVIRDWLTLSGKAHGDPTVWIDAIMRETHGWPQHVISYLKPAVRRILADGGRMTPEGLADVLQAGDHERKSYYRLRTDAFNELELRALMQPFPVGRAGGSTSYPEIMESLKGAFSPQEADRLYWLALEKGVLSKHGNDYVIPIPSMHAWMEKHYRNRGVARDGNVRSGRSQRKRTNGLGLER